MRPATASNRAPFDYGRAVYLALNGLLLAFLLAPIAIVVVFALNPTPYISSPRSASVCAGSRNSSPAATS